jgi:hypothetical protein
MAKLQKANCHKESLWEVFIPGTSFHMDLGFIRGSANLEEVVKDGATPTKTIVKSCDGYEAYLLIIDAATRYIWIFKRKTPANSNHRTIFCTNMVRHTEELSPPPVADYSTNHNLLRRSVKNGATTAQHLKRTSISKTQDLKCHATQHSQNQQRR